MSNKIKNNSFSILMFLVLKTNNAFCSKIQLLDALQEYLIVKER